MEARILKLINEERTIKEIRKNTGLSEKEVFGRMLNILCNQVTANINTDIENLDVIRIILDKLHKIIDAKSVPQKYAIRKIATFEKKLNQVTEEETIVPLIKASVKTMLIKVKENRKEISFKEEFEKVHNIIFEEKNYDKASKILKDNKMDIRYINNEHLLFYLVDDYIKAVVLNEYPSEINYYKKLIEQILQMKRYKLNPTEKALILAEVCKKTEQLKRDKKCKHRKKTVNCLNDLSKRIKNEEIKKIIVRTKNEKVYDRKNLVDEYTISIDSEKTKIVDDALSLKKHKNGNFLLGVHIADPNAIITRPLIINEDLIVRLKKHGYSNGINAPIFENRVSVKKLSLINNEVKAALSLLAEINPKGEVVNYSFKKTLISVDRNLTVNQANAIFFNKNEKDNKLMREFYCVAKILKEKNKGKQIYTGLKLLNESNYFSKCNDLKLIANNNSQIIVEESMVLFNNLLAEYCAENSIPIIFKNREYGEYILEKPDELYHIINRLQQDRYSDRSIVNTLLNLYPPIELSTENKGNSSVNVEAYCAATCPLRYDIDRLSAYTMERCIFGNPSKSELECIEDKFEVLVPHLNKFREPIGTNPELDEKAKIYIKELKRF